MLQLSFIKTMLQTFGIRDLGVTFDVEGRQIIAKYTQAGQPQVRLIPFSEIEELFTEGPIQAPAGPPQGKRLAGIG